MSTQGAERPSTGVYFWLPPIEWVQAELFTKWFEHRLEKVKSAEGRRTGYGHI
jgi:hypothetical protein